MARRAVAGAAVLLWGLVGCSQPARLDGARMEATILAQMTGGLDLPVSSVSCPDDVEVAADGRFTCRATTPAGVVDVAVRQVDDEGTLAAEPTEAVLVTERVEADVVAALADRFAREDVAVTCPGPDVRIEEVGARFTCRARDGDDTRPVEVRVRDPRGALAYSVGDATGGGAGTG